MWVGTRHGMLRLSRTSVGLIPLPGAADSDFGTVYQDTNKDLWTASNKLFRIRRGVARPYVFPQLGGALVRKRPSVIVLEGFGWEPMVRAHSGFSEDIRPISRLAMDWRTTIFEPSCKAKTAASGSRQILGSVIGQKGFS